MPVIFARRFPPATAADIEAAERGLGAPLPEDFKALLSLSNGGPVESNVVHVPPTLRAGTVGIAAILGVRRSDSLDIEVRAHEYAGRLPDGFLPIADAEGGNLLIVSTRPVDYGSVWFWNHELEHTAAKHPAEAGDSISWVARDIATMIASTSPPGDTIGPGIPPRVLAAWIDPELRDELNGRS